MNLLLFGCLSLLGIGCFAALCEATCDYAGAVEVGEKCYFKLNNLTSWDSAGAACAAESAQLASFTDSATYDSARAHLSPDCPKFWIGLNDKINETGSNASGPWEWSDGTAYSWNKWLGGFPMADLGSEELGVDCVAGSSLGHVNAPCNGGAVLGIPASFCSICSKPETVSQIPPFLGGGTTRSCTIDWGLTPIGGLCYKASPTVQTREEAQANCQSWTANLARFGSATDATTVYTAAALAHQSCTAFWIGLNDKAAEGTYVWQDGSSSSSFTPNWLPGFPIATVDLDCVAGVDGDGAWVNVPCAGQPGGLPATIAFPVVEACPLCAAGVATPTTTTTTPSPSSGGGGGGGGDGSSGSLKLFQ